MKLRLIFLCLAAPALASVAAGPYQTVLYWYAYRLEVVRYGPASTRIGKGCAGTLPGGGCYFDEFIKYIQLKGPNITPFQGSTGVGTDLTPDVMDATNKLKASGYSSTMDPTKLLPDVFPPDTSGRGHSLAAILNPMMENIDETRKDMAAAGINENNSEELDGIRRALIAVVDGRRLEYSAAQIETFNQEKITKGWTFTTETKMHLAQDGSTYEALDFDLMLTRNPNATPEIRSAISGFTSWYNSQNTKKVAGRRHWNAILAFQNYESRLLAPLPCSP